MDFKQQLIDNLDTEEVIKTLCDDYTPGNNISCLFADEKHADGTDYSKSMSISPKGQVYCHACGYKASSLIGLIEDLKGKTYKGACRWLVNNFIEPLVSKRDIEAAHKKLLRDKFTLLKLKQLRGLNDQTISKYLLGLQGNRITIPIRNEYNFWCNIRLYDLLSQGQIKICSFKKGYGKNKLYPFSAFSLPGTLYIMEGEMDTLLARQMGLNAITNTTGAAFWSKELSKYFKGRDVVLVPDQDKAGLDGLNKRIDFLVKYAKSVSVIHLTFRDKKSKDFTDFIIKEQRTIKDFHSLKVEQKSKGDARPDEDKKYKVSANELAYLDNAEIAHQDMLSRGGFFKDQQGKLFFAKEGGNVFPVTSKNQNFLSTLCEINPVLNSSTITGKFTITHIINKANNESAATKSANWVMYHKDNIYISGSEGHIIKASKGELTLIKNALNKENILIESPDSVIPLHITKTKEAKALGLLESCVIKNLALSNENKYLLICWLLGIFFKDLVKVKPLMRLSASTAYGKSTATKLLTNLLYGDDFLQHASTTASIYTMAQKYPFLAFDNIETRNMTPEFEDFLLVAATGGTKSKRQLSTDSGFILETVDCLTLTNGIEPFSKNEIISRTIDLKLDIDKYGQPGHFDELNVMRSIRENRDAIMSGLLKLLSDKVVSRINKGEIYRIANRFGSHSKERFNEYYGLMALLLDAVWPYIPLKGYTPKVLVDYWLNAQTSVNLKQSSTTNEVLYFFETFASKHKALLDLETKIISNEDSLILKGSARSLLSDFRLLSKHLGIRCPWVNEHQLGTRINDGLGTLEKNYWSRSHTMSCGRKIYKFVRRTK